MNQLEDYRHRLTVLQQWRCTQIVRILSAVLFTISFSLLLFMFLFAFIKTPDVMTCRSIATKNQYPHHLLSSSSTSVKPLLYSSPNESNVSQTIHYFVERSLPSLWPPKVLQSMQCEQSNESVWFCHELFTSAARQFMFQLFNSTVNRRSTSQPSVFDWKAIEKNVKSWYQSPMLFDGEWTERVVVASELFPMHLIQLRRSNFQYGFRLHCSHSYKALDNLFDCRPASACDYKLFALLHLAVFQLGIAWFACGSLSLEWNVRPEARFEQYRRDKHLLNTLKHAQALLMIVNAFCFLVHGLVPLAAPLLYFSVYYFNMQISLARTLTLSIIVIQYILYTVCGVVLRSL